jgi:hypothetical protein
MTTTSTRTTSKRGSGKARPERLRLDVEPVPEHWPAASKSSTLGEHVAWVPSTGQRWHGTDSTTPDGAAIVGCHLPWPLDMTGSKRVSTALARKFVGVLSTDVRPERLEQLGTLAQWQLAGIGAVTVIRARRAGASDQDIALAVAKAWPEVARALTTARQRSDARKNTTARGERGRAARAVVTATACRCRPDSDGTVRRHRCILAMLRRPLASTSTARRSTAPVAIVPVEHRSQWQALRLDVERLRLDVESARSSVERWHGRAGAARSLLVDVEHQDSTAPAGTVEHVERLRLDVERLRLDVLATDQDVERLRQAVESSEPVERSTSTLRLDSLDSLDSLDVERRAVDVERLRLDGIRLRYRSKRLGKLADSLDVERLRLAGTVEPERLAPVDVEHQDVERLRLDVLASERAERLARLRLGSLAGRSGARRRALDARRRALRLDVLASGSGTGSTVLDSLD